MMIYMVFVTPVVLGFAMLAVDVGRTTVAKNELQGAADAAARYAAAGMLSSSTQVATAYSQAALACADQRVDGRAVAITASQVETGYWYAPSRTFYPTTIASYINAVRITLTQTIGGTGSVPLFAQMLNQPARTVKAVSVATATSFSTTVTAPASGNLWLSAAANNTTITNNQSDTVKYDSSGTATSPKQRPAMIDLTDLGLQPGDVVSFEGLSGTGNYGSDGSDTDADGNRSRMVSLGVDYSGSVPASGANGIANTRAPLAACMGIFMSDALPTASPQPAGLDFGTAALRDYTMLKPGVKQPFFIGDGKTSAGEVQKITVPAGATRIYMGMMDAWQWNDNVGSFTLKFYRGTKVTTVR